MTLLSFLKKADPKANANIIYVLNGLLYISIDGETIGKNRHIDLSLYKILLEPNVYQEIIHLGCLPILREYKKATKEFSAFIDDLSMYMEYDINTDYFWAKTSDKSEQQVTLYKKMTSIRHALLKYIFDKNLMSEEVYTNELDHKVKRLDD